MSRTPNMAAVAGAAAVLVVAVWLDTSVVADAQRQAAATFSSSALSPAFALATIAVGAGCLAVGWLGSRAAPLVGLLYLVVGGFFALLPWLDLTLAASVNGAPAVLPDPIARAMGEVFFRTEGPLNAVGIVGGAMLVAGLVAIARSLRRRGLAGGADAAAPDPALA